MIPKTYDEWKACITVHCGLSLTPDYITQRLSALRDTQNTTTRRYLTLYGEDYAARVITWFERASSELNSQD